MYILEDVIRKMEAEGTILHLNKKWDEGIEPAIAKAFELLRENEQIVYAMVVPNVEAKSFGSQCSPGVLFVTNTRIIAGGQVPKPLTPHLEYAHELYTEIDLSLFSNIQKTTSKFMGMIVGTITITFRDDIIIIAGLTSDKLDFYYNGLSNAINSIAKEKESSNSTSNIAEQLRSFKELLDDGIITQEEFDAKKKQLLNI